MARWIDFEQAAPDLAQRVRERLDAHGHKTLATLRRDGSPRISGTETRWAERDLWIGSMWQARKARDLQRDGRYALHSGSDDPDAWTGDAKVAGNAEELTDDEALVEAVLGRPRPPGPAHLFRLGIAEAVLVELNDARDAIVITSWTPSRGLRTTSRA